MDAARELFIKEGIEATSIEEVTETAGYSRGAFYSNFTTKDDLVCAVLEREMRVSHDQIREAFSRDMPLPERLAAIRALYVSMGCDVKGCTFFVAMQLYALRSEAVRPRIAALLRSSYTAIAGLVRQAFEELGKEPPAPPMVVACSLLAQSQGLAIARLVDPGSIATEQFEHALGVYFDRLIGL